MDKLIARALQVALQQRREQGFARGGYPTMPNLDAIRESLMMDRTPARGELSGMPGKQYDPSTLNYSYKPPKEAATDRGREPTPTPRAESESTDSGTGPADYGGPSSSPVDVGSATSFGPSSSAGTRSSTPAPSRSNVVERSELPAPSPVSPVSTAPKNDIERDVDNAIQQTRETVRNAIDPARGAKLDPVQDRAAVDKSVADFEAGQEPTVADRQTVAPSIDAPGAREALSDRMTNAPNSVWSGVAPDRSTQPTAPAENMPSIEPEKSDISPIADRQSLTNPGKAMTDLEAMTLLGLTEGLKGNYNSMSAAMQAAQNRASTAYAARGLTPDQRGSLQSQIFAPNQFRGPNPVTREERQNYNNAVAAMRAGTPEARAAERAASDRLSGKAPDIIGNKMSFLSAPAAAAAGRSGQTVGGNTFFNTTGDAAFASKLDAMRGKGKAAPQDDQGSGSAGVGSGGGFGFGVGAGGSSGAGSQSQSPAPAPQSMAPSGTDGAGTGPADLGGQRGGFGDLSGVPAPDNIGMGVDPGPGPGPSDNSPGPGPGGNTPGPAPGPAPDDDPGTDPGPGPGPGPGPSDPGTDPGGSLSGGNTNDGASTQGGTTGATPGGATPGDTTGGGSTGSGTQGGLNSGSTGQTGSSLNGGLPGSDDPDGGNQGYGSGQIGGPAGPSDGSTGSSPGGSTPAGPANDGATPGNTGPVGDGPAVASADLGSMNDASNNAGQQAAAAAEAASQGSTGPGTNGTNDGSTTGAAGPQGAAAPSSSEESASQASDAAAAAAESAAQASAESSAAASDQGNGMGGPGAGPGGGPNGGATNGAQADNTGAQTDNGPADTGAGPGAGPGEGGPGSSNAGPSDNAPTDAAPTENAPAEAEADPGDEAADDDDDDDDDDDGGEARGGRILKKGSSLPKKAIVRHALRLADHYALGGDTDTAPKFHGKRAKGAVKADPSPNRAFGKIARAMPKHHLDAMIDIATKVARERAKKGK